MTRPPLLALLETSPGRYEVSWRIPVGTDQGTYVVTAHIMRAGVDVLPPPQCTMKVLPPRVISTLITPRVAPAGPQVAIPTHVQIPAPSVRQPAPADPAGASVHDLPGWADTVATILAYVIVFFGMMIAAIAANFKGGWISALAMLAIAWFLRDIIISPLQRVAKWIILALFEALIELFNFVRTWLEGIIHYFEGNVFKAVVRILIVAAFMWIWELAQSIPAIANITQWILDTADKIIGWVNDTIDFVLKLIDDGRKYVDGWIDHIFAGMGELGRQLVGEVTGYVDTLFGGLSQRVAQVRAEIVQAIDIRTQFAHLQITVLGETVRLIPQRIQQELLSGKVPGRAADLEQLDLVAGPAATARAPAPAATVAPWDVVDEFQRELEARRTGYRPHQQLIADEVMGQLLAFRRGAPPDMEPWPRDTTLPEGSAPAPLDLPPELTGPGPGPLA